MSKQFDFLPVQAPTTAVLDLSNTLGSASLEHLAHQAKHLHFSAKTIILPEAFSTNDLSGFAQNLAKQWDVSGHRALMLIDLKDHQVRVMVGKQLENAGITDGYISGELLPHNFVPYVRQHDLTSAIGETWQAMDSRMISIDAQATTAYTSGTSQHSYQASSNSLGTGSFWLLLLALGATLLVVMWRSVHSKKKRLTQALNTRLNELYQQADEIGQASEYIDPDKNAPLAQKVADFFNQLTVLDKAKAELDHEQNPWKSETVVFKCLRLADVLGPQSQEILTEVNSVTGGVTKTIAATETSPKAISAVDNEPIKLPELTTKRFTRPAWSLTPQYAPPATVFNPGGGFMSLMLLMNQWDMNQRLDQITMANPGVNTWGNGGNDFGGGGADWGSSSDLGAGSDWGSSGDWGSGGDFGGGGGGSW